MPPARRLTVDYFGELYQGVVNSLDVVRIAKRQAGPAEPPGCLGVAAAAMGARAGLQHPSHGAAPRVTRCLGSC